MRVTFPKRRRQPESIVPMINVVFLLLIFFLMTAEIAPPDPFEVLLPAAALDNPAEGPVTLYLSGDGDLAWQDQQGDAALAQAVAAAGQDTLLLRADAGVEAATVATLLRALGDAGMTSVTLVTASP